MKITVEARGSEKITFETEDFGNSENVPPRAKTAAGPVDIDSRLKAHEKSLEISYHEVALLFQRFNFFMAGMAFLVVAFAAIAAADKPYKLHDASGAIGGLGLVLSLLFALINWMASCAIKSFDNEYLNAEEDLTDGPFRKIHCLQSHYPCESVWSKGWVGRAPHTWFVPLVFFAFWVVMLCFWGTYHW